MADTSAETPDAGKKKASKKKASKKTAKKRSSRRGRAEPASRGLAAQEVGTGEASVQVVALREHIVADGGAVLSTYRDPLGGHWQVFAALPLDKIEPTPFQRDLSVTHAKRMTDVIDKLGRFLDPVITVRTDDGKYWTPNGLHRLTAMSNLGARSVVALVLPDFRVCYQILALNTEKAHNLKEKSLEVIRMARSLASLEAEPEAHYQLEFEDPIFLTVGVCYEQRPRFSGSVYSPVLKRCDAFMDQSLSDALIRREAWAEKLLAIDDGVAAAVKGLKARGFDSPYLKNFVVARVNPVRFSKGSAEMEPTLEKMLAKITAFDVGGVKEEQIAASGGAPAGDD